MRYLPMITGSSIFKDRRDLVPAGNMYGTRARRPGRRSGEGKEKFRKMAQSDEFGRLCLGFSEIFVSAKPHNGTGDGGQRLILAAHGPNFILMKIKNLRIAIQWAIVSDYQHHSRREPPVRLDAVGVIDTRVRLHRITSPQQEGKSRGLG